MEPTATQSAEAVVQPRRPAPSGASHRSSRSNGTRHLPRALLTDTRRHFALPDRDRRASVSGWRTPRSTPATAPGGRRRGRAGTVPLTDKGDDLVEGVGRRHRHHQVPDPEALADLDEEASGSGTVPLAERAFAQVFLSATCWKARSSLGQFPPTLRRCCATATATATATAACCSARRVRARSRDGGSARAVSFVGERVPAGGCAETRSHQEIAPPP